jgi:hypothetical protein
MKSEAAFSSHVLLDILLAEVYSAPEFIHAH